MADIDVIGNGEDEEESDEPLPSGTGEPSRDVSPNDLEGWDQVMTKWHSNLSSRPKQLSELVIRGIPDALRGEVWQLLAGVTGKNTNNLMDQYRLLITQDSKYERQIQRDVHRTFPVHPFFKDEGSVGQDSLFKLCKAYANYDTEIGYCQGLSFLVAALLLHMPEEQVICF